VWGVPTFPLFPQGGEGKKGTFEKPCSIAIDGLYKKFFGAIVIFRFSLKIVGTTVN
jgi:hypothetical protein